MATSKKDASEALMELTPKEQRTFNRIYWNAEEAIKLQFKNPIRSNVLFPLDLPKTLMPQDIRDSKIYWNLKFIYEEGKWKVHLEQKGKNWYIRLS